ncbi:MAG: hypothetical protein EOO70_01845 [Myxococcaceae bacterium]|nr:MAG: hypothetical protein EOO70_01845 [Myxococcaceae bacterium]
MMRGALSIAIWEALSDEPRSVLDIEATDAELVGRVRPMMPGLVKRSVAQRVAVGRYVRGEDPRTALCGPGRSLLDPPPLTSLPPRKPWSGALTRILWQALSPEEPRRASDVAKAISHPLGATVSRLSQLQRQGIVVRVDRGLYLRGSDPRTTTVSSSQSQFTTGSHVADRQRQALCCALLLAELRLQRVLSLAALVRRTRYTLPLVHAAMLSLLDSSQVVLEPGDPPTYRLPLPHELPTAFTSAR